MNDKPMGALPSKNQSSQLEAIRQALDAAAIALPVLFNMCTAANLRAGAMAADEILGSVKYAQKEMAHLLSGATSAPETTADCSTGLGGVTLGQMAENIKHGLDPYTGDQMDIEAIRFLAAGQDDPQSMALAACANEIDRLRAKSNSRPDGLIRSEVAAEIMDAIDELIKPGKLQGSGLDETAQRNGLILAYNTISQKFGEYRTPEASPLKANRE